MDHYEDNNHCLLICPALTVTVSDFYADLTCELMITTEFLLFGYDFNSPVIISLFHYVNAQIKVKNGKFIPTYSTLSSGDIVLTTP